MKKGSLFVLGILICLFAFVGCKSPAKKLFNTISPTRGITPASTSTTLAVTIPSPTISTPEAPGLVKTSLEFYRNGKTYEIIVGYDLGDAIFYSTPRPIRPKKIEGAYASNADIKRYADFDKDGEIEFLVSVIYCGPYCSEEIRVYKYDPLKDGYFIADRFNAEYPAVESYEDYNQDENPELVAGNYGFCFRCGSYTSIYSAIMILRYEQGKFKDVTKEYPDLIEQDAQKYLDKTKSTDNHSADITLASYFYDMTLLGKAEEARQVFDQLCATILEPRIQSLDFNCTNFLGDVEASIKNFSQDSTQVTP